MTQRWTNPEMFGIPPGNSAGDLFWMVKRPFKGFSDLQLGDEKVTLNHLAVFS